MPKRLAIFLIGGVLFLYLVPTFGQNFGGSSYPERIKNFNVAITINKDSSVLVRETILYDFGENLKHGIYRDIPIDDIKIKVIKVVDGFNNPYPFKVYEEGWYLKIKIGDPDKLIKGIHTYNIFYKVEKGIGYFEYHDELYWNVTGNEWQVPIEESSATIHLPERVFEENLKFDCFTGALGSEIKDCTFKIDENGDTYFESKRSFIPREGLTIVLGWPKGIVKGPSFFQKFIWTILKLIWEIFLPVFIVIFTFIYLFKKWWREGKDPKLRKPIIAQYEPPDNLRPAEVRLIEKQRIGSKEISATLIDLAVRGYIKIKEINKAGLFKKDDYELTKLKNLRSLPEPGDLRDYEKKLLENIFGFQEKILISSLKNKFYTHLSRVIEEINNDVTSLKYFVSNPKQKVMKWLGISGILIVLAYFLGNFFEYLGISIGFSAILFFIFAFFMPKRTEKGAEAYWKILGFKEYINTAEKYRVQFQEKENIFEKYLPYAIVFGLADKWAKAFEGIYNTPPSWYEGDFGPRFTSYAFVNSLNRNLSNVNNAFVSRPGGGGSGFGGGGFSGGGGGGGGGGSW